MYDRKERRWWGGGGYILLIPMYTSLLLAPPCDSVRIMSHQWHKISYSGSIYNTQIGKCEKSGPTPPYPHAKEPVMNYLPTHCLTDLVSDLGVCMGWVIAYGGVFDQRIDILFYNVSIWVYSIKQISWCWWVVGKNTHSWWF